MKNEKITYLDCSCSNRIFLCAWQSLDAETVSKGFAICVLESIFAEA